MTPDKCESCGRKNRALPFHTADGTTWSALQGGWLFFVRNGVVIAVCSALCADKYIDGFNNRPMPTRR